MEDLLLIILQAIIEVFGESLLQSAPEVLLEIILHSISAGKGEPCNRFLAVIGYLLMGQAIAGLSLFAFPHSLIHSHAMRIANLFIAPVLAALPVTLIGVYRTRRGQRIIRLDKFGYAYAFAFSMALARFVWTK